MLCPERSAIQERTTQVSVEAHRDLFLGLVRDQDLRDALTTRPFETLSAFGIELEPHQVPALVSLPDEEHLTSALVDLVVPIQWNGFF